MSSNNNLWFFLSLDSYHGGFNTQIHQGRAHSRLHVHISQRGAKDAGAGTKSKGLHHQPCSRGTNAARSYPNPASRV